MTDEEDSAELSAGMTEEEESAELSAGMGGSQILSPEHAANQTIDAAHPIAAMPKRIFLNSQAIKPNHPLLLITLRPDLPGGHVQSRRLWLALP